MKTHRWFMPAAWSALILGKRMMPKDFTWWTLQPVRTVKERQRDLESVIGLDQILRQEQAATTNRNVAATRIQSAVRNKNALKETITKAQQKRDEINQSAATTIQSALRNKNAIKETRTRGQQKAAATRIQSAVRNKNALNETIKRAQQKTEAAQKLRIQEIVDEQYKNQPIERAVVNDIKNQIVTGMGKSGIIGKKIAAT